MLKKFINFVVKAYGLVTRFDIILDYKLRSNQLLNSALTSNESIVSDDIRHDKQLIVSFTTYSKRIYDVHLVIESIGQQTEKPNRLILWLDEDEFNVETIPNILHKQIKRGLEVRFCKNLKSYKKLVPTLKEYPDSNIITIDDDIIYPYDMIEGMVREHKLHPNCVIGNRVHRIVFDKNNNLCKYNDWEHEVVESYPSKLHMATGVGGILYPSGSLNKECVNEDCFLNLAPNADDIWFKAMAILNNFETKKVHDNRDFNKRFLLIENGQDIALGINNVIEGANDNQIGRVFSKYNITNLLK